jgi:epoxyqueuosine reductase
MTQLRNWALELGFSQIGVTDIQLADAEAGLQAWLKAGFHGEMDYMQRHGMKRARPQELVPGTVSVVCVAMNYLSCDSPPDWAQQELNGHEQPQQAVISLYARGRDYHKVLRQRLEKLAQRMSAAWGPMGHRVFTDSAPVLEVELATRAGLGWRGKHTLLLNRQAGSMFFLGEIYLDRPLPKSEPTTDHCGQCSACITACPTAAIVAPHRLDARRCISYLTIEHAGPIDEALRPLLGNRIYGCDDCQLVCPWNKYAQLSQLPDFVARSELKAADLLGMWQWTEADFLRHSEGSAIRRIGFERWQRNLAVAMGNAMRSPLPQQVQCQMQQALTQAMPGLSPLVQEHAQWALRQCVSDAVDF